MSEYIIEVSEWVIDANGNPPSGLGEEIVRCRNCVCFDTAEPQGCTLFDFAAPNHADGFCAWGEKAVEE